MLKKILIGLAAAAALFALVGALLPQTAHVERAIVVQAPPATVFTVLNGFRQFDQWSPWAGIDPDAKTTFEGPAFGVGAKMNWAGNDAVGTGSQEIVESTPYRTVRLRLGFGDFPGTFASSYTLQPGEGGTQVTWAFDADYGGSLLGRYFGLASDSMIGPDYDKGLGRLKQFAESLPKGNFSALRIETTSHAAEPLVLMKVRSANDANAIGVALGVAYGKLSGFITTQGLKQVAPPIAIFNGEDGGALSLEAALPVDREDVAVDEPIRAGHTHAGRVVKAVYRGAYSGLADAREQLRAYVAAAGYTTAGALWEQYVSDPGQTAPADLVTEIYLPIR